MNELNKETMKHDSSSKANRCIAILTSALVIVVAATFYVLRKHENKVALQKSSTKQPYSKSDQLVSLGWDVYRERSDVNKAEQLFQEARRLAPYHQRAIDACGQMAILQHDYKRAFKLFYCLHVLSHQSRHSYVNLTIALIMLERYHEAKAKLEEATKKLKLKDDVQFMLLHATIEKKLQNDLKANELLQKAIEKGGDNAEERIVRIINLNKWAACLKHVNVYLTTKSNLETRTQ